MKKYGWLVVVLVSIFCRASFAQENVKTNMDERIVRVLERRLEREEAVPSHAITAASKDQTVTLSGTVDNLLAKERALAIAKSMRGVREVRDQMEVKTRLRPDSHIRQNVIDALQADISADAFETEVQVEGGIVTLSGTAQSWQERHRAEQATKSITGVKGIENEIRVQSVGARSEMDVERDIASRLKWDVWLDAPMLRVDVQDGRAVLSGTVESVLEKERAYSHAWVPGVNRVDVTGVKVAPLERPQGASAATPAPAPATDNELEAALRQAYQLDPLVLSARPEVEVRRGVAALSGSVYSLQAKQRAEEIARQTAGIVGVRNGLKVRPRATIADGEVATQVRLALGRDAQLEDDALRVGVENGRVYLSGTVDSRVERARAENIASGVHGVLGVRNALAVPERGRPGKFEDSGPAITDASIKYQTEEHLWFSPAVDADQIKVSAQDGVVTLTGAVDSWFEYNAAEEAAREAGAMRVKNRLTVAPAQGRR